MTLLGRPLHAGHAILALLVLVVLFAGMRLARALTTPLPPGPHPASPFLADPQALSGPDIFFPRTTQELPVTALPFSLHGIRLDEATGRGSAIIATEDGAQNVYAVGDPLGPDTSLVAIAADHVVLSFRGAREALWLDVAGDGAEDISPADSTPRYTHPDATPSEAPAAVTPPPAAGLPAIPTGDAAAVPSATGPRKNAP